MGFSQYGYRSESRSAIDNEVPLYLAGQNKQAVSRVAPGAGDDGLDVFADEVRTEHGGGKIARFGYGPTGSETWQLEITSDGVTMAGYLDTGSQVHDARAYGAVLDAHIDAGQWVGTDNSQALQDACNAAGSGGTVYLTGDGTWLIDAPINLTNLDEGITIIGDTQTRSRIIPGPNMTGKTLFDCSGSAGIKFRYLAIGDTANPSIPAVGVLVANSSTRPAGANVYDWEEFSISGTWSKAAVYVCALVSSRFRSLQVQNYHASGVPMWLTANNEGAVTSEFVPISATGGVGELGFWGCEWHGNATTAPSLICENTFQITIDGGNMSTGGVVPHVLFRGPNVNFGFENVQLYTDVDPTPNAFTLDTGATMTGMVVTNCRLDADVAVFGGASGTSYTRLVAHANTVVSGASRMVQFSTGGSLIDCDLECNGLGVDCGTGTITRGWLKNPGTITASGGFSALVQGSTGGLTAPSGTFSSALTAPYGAFGSSVSPSGQIRLPVNFSIRYGGSDLPAVVGDGAGNLTFGGVSGVGICNFAGSALNLYVGSNLRISANTAATQISAADASNTALVQLTTTPMLLLGVSAPAVGATSGLPNVPAMAGPPTGGITPPTGYATGPVIDTSTNRVYFRVGGTWRYAALT